MAPFEIDEQQTHLGVGQGVAPRQEHPVAVVIREGDRRVVHHRHEAGIAALIGTARASLSVGSGQEEHVRPLDEGTIVGLEAVLHELLRDAVRQLAGAEAVLEAPAAGVEPPLCGRPLEGPARPVEIAQDPLELSGLLPRLGPPPGRRAPRPSPSSGRRHGAPRPTAWLRGRPGRDVPDHAAHLVGKGLVVDLQAVQVDAPPADELGVVHRLLDLGGRRAE